MLRTDQLAYDLPERLIATAPAVSRDAARMLVVSRSDPARLEHRTVRDLPGYLGAGDVAVFNRSRVLRARLVGARADTGGRVEGLYLDLASGRAGAWRVLLRSNGRLRAGQVVRLRDANGALTDSTLSLVERAGEAWIVWPEPSVADASAALEAVGRTPLPPYILHARHTAGFATSDASDRARYQTVYAEADPAPGAGSVAAPTAGLHFTPELLERLDGAGVRRLCVDLHVGYGTFQPVQTECVEDHPIHAERCSAPARVARALLDRQQSAEDGRLFAVGTTTARTLESIPDPIERWTESGWSGSTRLLITPGYRWRRIDGMLTNFHLPRSTLLAMVAALFPGGADRLLELYRVAVRERYRFYSFGDAMLILP